MKSIQKGVFALLIAVGASALLPLVYRGVGDDIAILFANGLSRLAVFFVYLILVLSLHSWKKPNRSDWLVLALRALVGAGAFLGDFFAVQNLQIGTSYFVYNAGIIAASFLLGALIFKEKTTITKIISLLLALAGLLLVYGNALSIQSGVEWLVVAFLGGLCGALWSTLEKLISSKIHSIQIAMIDFGFVALVYLLLSVLFQEQWSVPVVNTSWLSVFGIASLIGCIGYAVVAGFRRLEAETGSLILLAQIPLVVLLGYVVFSEQLSVYTIIGGVCIIISACLPFVVPLFAKNRTSEHSNRIHRINPHS